MISKKEKNKDVPEKKDVVLALQKARAKKKLIAGKNIAPLGVRG